MNADETVLDKVTERIIGGALMVSNALGSGFIEKVYENALAHELRKTGLAVAQQHGIVVRYDGIIVGEYAADVHRAQCVNYLRATGLHVCLLLNFGNPHMEIKRIVLGL